MIKIGLRAHEKRGEKELNLKAPVKAISAILIVCMISSLCSGCAFFDGSNRDEADLYEYYGVTGDEYALVIDGEQIADASVAESDGVIYIDIDTVADYLNKKIYYDDTEGLILITNAAGTNTHVIGTSYYTDYLGNEIETGVAPAIVSGETLLVSMEFVEIFTVLESFDVYSEPNRVDIVLERTSFETVTVTGRKSKIRTGDSSQNEILAEAVEGDELELIEEGSLYSKVKTSDDIIGYILTENISDAVEVSVEIAESDEPEYTHLTRDETISMVWHQVSGKAGNETLSSLAASVSNVNVISPTWFTMADGSGAITSYATASYVKKAHSLGLEVWALADDFSSDSDGNRYVDTVLSSTSSRQALVNNLVSEAVSFGIDGINIDFEYIGIETADDYLQFLRELSAACRANGLVLSIDNYVPSDYSGYYDRNQQGEIADYVICMSYDEHNSSSDESGSVASISYVTEAVAATVEEVGNSAQVINGVPFYTRIWTETPEEYADEGAEIIEDAVNGNFALSSSAVSMAAAKSAYVAAGAEPVWSDECGQYVVTYESGSSTCLIWLEEAESIALKMALVDEYALGGAAYWKLGMETDDIWDVIGEYVN